MQKNRPMLYAYVNLMASGMDGKYIILEVLVPMGPNQVSLDDVSLNNMECSSLPWYPQNTRIIGQDETV